MAAHVALSQALSYARDLRTAHAAALEREQALVRASRRLRRAHQQALSYARDLHQTHERLQRAIFQSLRGLANALEAKDRCTHGHSARVARSARRLARRAGLPAGLAETIAQAGLLHDLGKIAVPGPVLRKAGPLDGAEWETMRRHPVTSAQIVAPLEFFADGAIIVLHHHERVDGSGYPDGLRGDQIPLGARIVAVADVYDALVSDRPYRRRLAPAAALGVLRREAGRTLDERLAGLFIELVESGEIAADPLEGDGAPAALEPDAAARRSL
jgi:HD-GYP domain-containing protein (c-di-GMP phosphodiesterase class II)